VSDAKGEILTLANTESAAAPSLYKVFNMMVVLDFKSSVMIPPPVLISQLMVISQSASFRVAFRELKMIMTEGSFSLMHERDAYL
jgi:hypothetical protein